MTDDTDPTLPPAPEQRRPPFVPRNPTPPPPLPSDKNRFVFGPMPQSDHAGGAVDALLKHPGQVIYQLHESPAPARLLMILGLMGLLGLTFYGLVVGSFSGGAQWYAAPVKIVAGTFFSALICLPSLYIFACLSGAQVRLGPLGGSMMAAIALQTLLLLGFTPVAWVFSQSTDSVAFMGAMHLLFWGIGLYFGLRLISGTVEFIGAGDRGYLKIWIVIFLLVSLQMTTALRPILGRAPTFLPTEKRFFLVHWIQNVFDDGSARAESSSNRDSASPQPSPDARNSHP